jgi:hypothetical protein
MKFLDIKFYKKIIPNIFSQFFNKVFEILQIFKKFKKKTQGLLNKTFFDMF